MVWLTRLLWALASSPVALAHPKHPSAHDSPSVPASSPGVSPRDSHIFRRDLTYGTDCHQEKGPAVRAAWSQAYQMVNHASKAMGHIVGIIESPEDAHLFLSLPGMREQWPAYLAIFGGFTEFPDTLKPEDQSRMLPIARYVAEVFRNALVAMSTPANLNIEIHCTDRWLRDTDPDGKPPPGPDQFWDNRPTHHNLMTQGWVYMPGNPRCEPEDGGFTNAKVWGQGWDVVTLCPGMFASTWIPQQNNAETLQDVCSRQHPGTVMFDNLVRDKIARLLVHELMHSPNVIGKSDSNGNSPITDVPCPGDPSKDAYGWACVTDLAEQDPGKAKLNADNYSYFAAAVYCNGNNWSTGWAKPMAT